MAQEIVLCRLTCFVVYPGFNLVSTPWMRNFWGPKCEPCRLVVRDPPTILPPRKGLGRDTWWDKSSRYLGTKAWNKNHKNSIAKKCRIYIYNYKYIYLHVWLGLPQIFLMVTTFFGFSFSSLRGRPWQQVWCSRCSTTRFASVRGQIWDSIWDGCLTKVAEFSGLWYPLVI
jgi:hypothetical protein